jgi:hypothetical protein
MRFTIGGDDVLIILLPPGVFRLAEKYDIDLAGLAQTVILERIRSSETADKMMNESRWGR